MEVLETQMLDTGRFGQIHVVQTWVMREKSISKLANGAYVHTTGLPLKNKGEITEVIPPGRDQDEALYWFEHRHETPEVGGRRIVMDAEGNFEFEDGSPITSISEITAALKPGPHQETVIRWFIAVQEGKLQARQKEKPEWQKPEPEEQAPPPPKPKGSKAAPRKNVKKQPAAMKPSAQVQPDQQAPEHN